MLMWVGMKRGMWNGEMEYGMERQTVKTLKDT